MNVRNFAFIYGPLFALVGIAGFIPGLVTPHDPVPHQLTIDQGAGELLGLFPVNVVHNLVHLGFGIWGARGVPQNAGRGWLLPLHGNDIWLRAVLAAGAAYVGFIHDREPRHASGPAPRGT
jgi:hypothetical protein